ncbi:g11576 [Coccomyxa viridis]|uniref:G11576 protein n=1 Tax=Coccomyxa viridis TaxID=1274662 RepID=A0ABP1G890_9CHLO
MSESQASVSVLRHGRDPQELRAGPSGRSSSLPSMPSLATAIPNQLQLLAVPAGWESCTSNHSIPRLLLLACLLSMVFLALQLTNGDTLEYMMLWIQREPVKGGVLFVVVDTAAVTIMFPGAIFAMAGGAIFGVPLGCALVWVGTTVGQTLAFIVGRYLLRGVVMRYLNSRFPKWAAVDAALSNEGWKLVTLLRLSPVVPWNVLNYALSVTGVKLLPYCISSALAIIPWSILFCYFGSLARNITEILDGKAGPSGKQSMLLLGVSGAVLVFVVVYSTIIARRAIRKAMAKTGVSADSELETIAIINAAGDGADGGADCKETEPLTQGPTVAGRRGSTLDSKDSSRV